MGAVVKEVVAELMSEVAEGRGRQRDGQFRSSKRQSAINAAIIMVDGAHATCTNGQITGMLLMDIKAAFPSMAKGMLLDTMKVKQMDGGHIRWMKRFLSERTKEMIIECRAMEIHPVEAGVPLCAPVSPILFAIYIPGVITEVEQYISAEGLSFVDNLGWVGIGSDVNPVVTRLESCTAKSIEWTSRRGLQFDMAIMEAALFTCTLCHKKHLRPKLAAQIQIQNGFIPLTPQATRLLCV